MGIDSALQNDYADALAFVGNSLLAPMSMTSPVGLDPEFWAAFPTFGDAAIVRETAALEEWAHAKAEAVPNADDAVLDISVEYTKLFVGPPSPLAPPWETMNGATGVTVGFGEPTFQMKRLLRDAGLQLSNENRQYEDHMGIELLYASELARRSMQPDAASSATPETEDQPADAAAVVPVSLQQFLAEHPLSWIDTLSQKVQAAAEDGYHLHLLQLAKALMQAA